MDLQQQFDVLYQEARVLKEQRRLAEAAVKEAQAAQLLGELKTRVGQHPDDPETATALLFLAEREWALAGDQPDVQAKIERALAIRQASLGHNTPAAAEAYGALAEFHFLAGRFGEAEPLYRQAMAIFEHSGGGRGQTQAKCLGGLAQTLASVNRPTEADPYFAQAIERTRQEGDKRVLYFLLIYRAEGLEKMGRAGEGERLRQEAAALLPKNNPGEAGYHV